MKIKKILTIGFVILILILTITGCAKEVDNKSQEDGKIEIYASIYPLYDFATKIGGERVNVNLIVPPGAEPHNWEPTAKLLVRMKESDIIVYNGGGMESWIERVKGAIDDEQVHFINSSEGIDLLMNSGEHHEGDNHGKYDPHIWLDPINAIKQGENIKNALIKIDGANKSYYDENYQKFVADMKELDSQYREAISNSPRKELVVSHAAFGYLANRYELVQIPIKGITPQEEPTPSKMAEIADMIKEKDIKYIFLESLSNDRISKVLAEDTGVEVMTLDTLGGLSPEQMESSDYISVMEQNLKKIIKALGE